jgi:hypothetical protein
LNVFYNNTSPSAFNGWSNIEAYIPDEPSGPLQFQGSKYFLAYRAVYTAQKKPDHIHIGSLLPK